MLSNVLATNLAHFRIYHHFTYIFSEAGKCCCDLNAQLKFVMSPDGNFQPSAQPNPVAGGYKYGNLALQVGGVSDESVKYGYGFCASRTFE
jgi:hypothetical protein